MRSKGKIAPAMAAAALCVLLWPGSGIAQDSTEGVRLRSGLTFSELETTPPRGSKPEASEEALANPPRPVMKPPALWPETEAPEEDEEPVAEIEPEEGEATEAAEASAEPQVDPFADVAAFLRADVKPEPAPEPAPTALEETAQIDGPASPKLRSILGRNILRAGTVLRTPYAMRDSTGTLIGHDVALARELAQTLGVGIRFETLRPDELTAALRDDRIDVVVGGFAIDPARALEVNFTRPYGTMDIHLVTPAQHDIASRSAGGLSGQTVEIGAVWQSPSEKAARAHFPRAKIVTFADDASAKAAFITGEITALASPSPFPEMLDLLSPGNFVRPLRTPLARTAHGLAIAQGDPEFLAYLNAWIVTRELDNTFARAHAYWFEGTDWVRRLAGRQAGLR